MPTHNSAFRSIIFETLEDSGNRGVSIEKFYKAAEARITFDDEDLASTISKGKNTGEPSWKRNLRNCLQGLKSSGEIVNSTVGHWRLPSLNEDLYIDPNRAWQEVVRTALKGKAEGQTWTSPIDRNVYHIDAADQRKIIIRRHSTNTVVDLSATDVQRAINSINAAGGRAGRRTLLNIVAKESALVHLHPNLSWDKQFEFIEVTLIDVIPSRKTNIAIFKSIFEADDDDPVYQSYARKIRRGQNALRRNLLQVYGFKCCISGTGPENVLQAAHIEPHVKSGNNQSTNALLLRSDIHDLFDDGLILIEPITYKIMVHPDLKDTIYAGYDGKFLAPRLDGKTPNDGKLEERLDSSGWVNQLSND